MFKNSDKEKNTETAIKLLNQYADSYHQLENQIKNLKQENKDLYQNLLINKEIIQNFFKNSTIDKKINILINKTKLENKILYSQIEQYKKEIKELTYSLNEMYNIKNELNIANNKLFMFQNLLSEKMNIIKNLNKRILSNKSKIKNNDNEIYIIDPSVALNKMNDNLEHYKEVNNKLSNHINTFKETLIRKEKEIKKLTNELNSLKKELSQFKQQKNNIEIIAQLNQYNAINTSIGKNTLSKTYNIINSNDLFNSLNYNLNISKERKKIYNEIDRLENINKSKKEIIEKQFDLTSEWYDTLKHCNMTQEEYINYCNNKNTIKLTDVIEYLYKYVIDKNLQIKLLTEENDYLNSENLKLNRINLELVDEFGKKKILKDNNSTFVNVDNNLNNNLNINMMMDYIKEVKQSVTSSEFREGITLDQFDMISDVNIYSMKNSILNSERDKKKIEKNLIKLPLNSIKNIENNNINCSNGASSIKNYN